MAKIKVIQYATGMAGKEAIRAMADHPELELVGCLVFNPDKVGKDAGEIAGIGKLGVKTTDRFEDILAMKADAVSFMGLWPDLDKICPLLESGKHVAMTCGMVCPPYVGQQAVDRLTAACKKGKTSVFGGGVSPGFIQSVAPVVLSSMSRRIDYILMQEFVDMRPYNSPDLILKMLGFGRTLKQVTEDPHPEFETMMPSFFNQGLALLAEALQLPVERYETKYEYGITPGGSEGLFGKMAPGTVGGMRVTFQAFHQGTPKLIMELNWVAAFDMGPGWLQLDSLSNSQQWKVTIEGDPSLKLTSEQASTFASKMASAEHTTDHAVIATAMNVLHAIPHMVAAREPGIKTYNNLPMLAGRFTARGKQQVGYVAPKLG